MLRRCSSKRYLLVYALFRQIIIPSTQILARVFVYLPPFISQILDFICRMVLIFILIYFGWRDTENQQYAQQELVMMNYASEFSQSETEKYFE